MCCKSLSYVSGSQFLVCYLLWHVTILGMRQKILLQRKLNGKCSEFVEHHTVKWDRPQKTELLTSLL